ncbi:MULTISPECIES: HEPN domain-containing protein [Yersinia]|uniref:HEPN domain-containing protein n=1 Tax=Yersinia pekkanenii TaxID=1288385 RepID=A0A0T9PRG6_9GAMM|nr:MULTISPECIES: HEPN domain-containing protein [Yersinia]CNH77985.1 Uncharacterised protein [Yersinia pekkanenii]CNK54251.1 Uncharacterised protein [Yersinia pseudotuberculosis]CRY69370.1 Uncharacterised protein [Yersinia pekkanenii]
MSITSNEVLLSAKNCYSHGCEADFRNAVSRAYYAMYHEARDSLTCRPNYAGSQHSNLIGYLKNKSENKLEPHDTFKMKLLGYQLDQQRRARTDADYELESLDITEAIANVAIKTAEEFFDEWLVLKTLKAV